MDKKIEVNELYNFLKDNNLLNDEENKDQIVWLLQRQAMNLEKNKLYDKLVVYYSEILKIRPKDDHALLKRGISYLLSDQPVNAKRDFMEVVNNFSENNGTSIKMNNDESYSAFLNTLLLATLTKEVPRDMREEYNLIKEIFSQNSRQNIEFNTDINAERDFKKLGNCLDRIAKVIFSANPTEADAEGISVDLRKLLFDSTAEVIPNRRKTLNRKGSLIKRHIKHMNFPRIIGINNSNQLNEIAKNIGLTCVHNVPFGNGPLVTDLREFLTIDNWLEQKAMTLCERDYTIKEVFTLLANIDGAHTDTTERIEVDKIKDKGLIINDEIGYRLILNTAEFIFIWMVQHEVLRRQFPILEYGRGKFEFSLFHQGFIPSIRV